MDAEEEEANRHTAGRTEEEGMEEEGGGTGTKEEVSRGTIEIIDREITATLILLLVLKEMEEEGTTAERLPLHPLLLRNPGVENETVVEETETEIEIETVTKEDHMKEEMMETDMKEEVETVGTVGTVGIERGMNLNAALMATKEVQEIQETVGGLPLRLRLQPLLLLWHRK